MHNVLEKEGSRENEAGRLGWSQSSCLLKEKEQRGFQGRPQWLPFIELLSWVGPTLPQQSVSSLCQPWCGCETHSTDERSKSQGGQATCPGQGGGGVELALHPQPRAAGLGALTQGSGLPGPPPHPPVPLRPAPRALHVSWALEPELHPRLDWPPPSPKCQVWEPRPQSLLFLPAAQLATTTRPILLIPSTCPHLTWFLDSWGPGGKKKFPSPTLDNCLWGPGQPMPLQWGWGGGGVGGGCHLN